MSDKRVILRVDATYDLTVKVGERVRRGEWLSRDRSRGAASAAPVMGIVESIQFDPAHHEFVIVIADAQ